MGGCGTQVFSKTFRATAMKLRFGLAIALYVITGSVMAQAYDPSTAFSDGRSLGSGSINNAFQGIGNGTGAQAVPGYGQNSTQSQYFQNGQGQLSGPGIAKITDCSTLPPDADTYRRQECDAINFVARNPAVRPPFSIDRANDPLITNANAIARNPTMTFTGITAGTSTEQCRVVTDTQPATFATETCNDYHEVTSNFCSTARQITVDQNHLYQCVEQMQTLSNASCFIGQQIAVNTSYNYQCNQTVQGYETLSCRRGVSATVGFGQCTPGAWLGRAAYVDCPNCLDPYMAMNIYCGSDGISYSVEPYRSSDGVNRFDYNTIGYPWNGSYGQFPVAVAPGQSITDYYVSNLGFGCNLYVYFSVSCSATTCIPSMRNVSSGCNSSGGTGTGAPLQLPMSKTVSTWTSNECVTLQQRAQ
jgi:hypothetical protein